MRLFLLILSMVFCIQCKTVSVEKDAVHLNEILGFYAGPLGDFYQLENNGDFSMMDESLEVTAVYNNRVSGNYTMADVSNPQKLLLYAPLNNKILFLDNDLSELESIVIPFDLYPDVPAVAISNDNQIWFWDNVNQQLNKMNMAGNITTQGNRMYDYSIKIEEVDELREEGNKVFLKGDNKVYIFDNFGQYLNKVKVDALGTVTYGPHSLSYFNNAYQWVRITTPLMNETVTPSIDSIIEKPNDIIKVRNTAFLIYDDRIEKRSF